MARWSTDDIPDQAGRTVLVTGASSGLGLRSAEALASHGARVLLACRNPDKGADALAQVQAAATGAAPELVLLDLADLASIRAGALQVAAHTDQLDGLINNAGVMAIPPRRTADGFEMQFGTNHLGHFALTGELLGLLEAAAAPRVVTVASNAHRVGRMRWDDLNWEHRYHRWMAYGQSKLANLLFAFELERQARGAHARLRSLAAHPGTATTHLAAVGPEMSGNRVAARFMEVGTRLTGQSDTMGALPQLRALTDPAAAGGQYYGPDGLGEMRGHPKVVKASHAANDRAAAARLWTRSEELTGTTYDWP